MMNRFNSKASLHTSLSRSNSLKFGYLTRLCTFSNKNGLAQQAVPHLHSLRVVRINGLEHFIIAQFLRLKCCTVCLYCFQDSSRASLNIHFWIIIAIRFKPLAIVHPRDTKVQHFIIHVIPTVQQLMRYQHWQRFLLIELIQNGSHMHSAKLLYTIFYF